MSHERSGPERPPNRLEFGLQTIHAAESAAIDRKNDLHVVGRLLTLDTALMSSEQAANRVLDEVRQSLS